MPRLKVLLQTQSCKFVDALPNTAITFATIILGHIFYNLSRTAAISFLHFWGQTCTFFRPQGPYTVFPIFERLSYFLRVGNLSSFILTTCFHQRSLYVHGWSSILSTCSSFLIYILHILSVNKKFNPPKKVHSLQFFAADF